MNSPIHNPTRNTVYRTNYGIAQSYGLFKLSRCVIIFWIFAVTLEPSTKEVVVTWEVKALWKWSGEAEPGPDSRKYFLIQLPQNLGKRTFIPKLAHNHFLKFLVSKKKIYPSCITEQLISPFSDNLISLMKDKISILITETFISNNCLWSSFDRKVFSTSFREDMEVQSVLWNCARLF